MVAPNLDVFSYSRNQWYIYADVILNLINQND